MKKMFFILSLLLLSSPLFANEVVLLNDINKDNFWAKQGIEVDKVLNVSNKIMMSNQIPRRVPVMVEKSKKIVTMNGTVTETVNAYSDTYNKNVTVLSGMFNYIDCDDELAYILAHEISHSVEAYGGLFKYLSMASNSKKYEEKADLTAIDYMVKAGYNPIAAITMGNKIFTEPMWDWGFNSSHPKGSKRLMNMYKYIFIKYPEYLNSTMAKLPAYKNFEYALNDDIKEFQQKQKKKAIKADEIL